jgi:ATP:corrinoid adenosyltransferase
LKQDHAAVKKLFAREKEVTKQNVAKVIIFDEIKAALETHATIEEEMFYPAVKKARSQGSRPPSAMSKRVLEAQMGTW